MTFSQAFANRIPYSENLISKLEDSIRIAIGHNKGQVKLAKRPQSRGDTYYCGLQFIANSSYANYVQLDNRSTEWVVAKAIKKGASSASTWIGSRFRFDKEGEQEYLVSCSVLILAHKDNFYPLIRAEWDYRGIADGRHAQPHWHMLTALQAKTQEKFVAFDVVDFEPNLNNFESERQESLHLAMGANWALSNGSKHTCELLDGKSLANWIRNVTEYSIDQVQYVLNKVGSQDIDYGVKNFSQEHFNS